MSPDPAAYAQAGRLWDARWDPQHYLPHAARSGTKFLWVNGTNDFAYPLDSMQRSYMAHHTAIATSADGNSESDISVPRLCVRVDMPHSHADGWAPEEIGAFADEVLSSKTGEKPTVAGPPLVTEFSTVSAGASGQHQLRCVVQTVGVEGALASVELAFSRALGYWPDRRYNRQSVPKEQWKRLPSIGKKALDRPPPNCLQACMRLRTNLVCFLRFWLLQEVRSTKSSPRCLFLQAFRLSLF